MILGKIIKFVFSLLTVLVLAFLISLNFETSNESAELEKPGSEKIMQTDLPVFYFSIKPLPLTRFHLKPEEDPVFITLFRQNADSLSSRNLAKKIEEKMDPYSMQELNNRYSENLLNTEITKSPEYLSWNEKKNSWLWLVPSVKLNPKNRFKDFFFGSVSSKGLLRGDLGVSPSTGKQAMDIILERSYKTLILTGLALIFAFLTGIPLAYYTVKKRNIYAGTLTAGVLVLYSIPGFVFTTILVALFRNSLPDLGRSDLFFTWPLIVLPVSAYAYAAFCVILLTARDSFKGIVKKDFIITAKAKGLGEKRIFFVHILPNSLPVLLTLLFSYFPHLMAGSVIIENIFNIPGSGNLLLTAVLNQDIPLISGFIIMIGTITVSGYFLSDLINSYLIQEDEK